MKTFEQEQMEQRHYEEKLKAAALAEKKRWLLVDKALLAIQKAKRSYAAFPSFRSPHEGFANLKDAVDGLWDEVRWGDLDAAKQEAVRVAAMALRFLVDC